MRHRIQLQNCRAFVFALAGVLSLALSLAAQPPSEAVGTLSGTVLTSGNSNGPMAMALFSDPTGLDIDAAGNVYIADNADHTIRKLSPTGIVSTLAGQSGSPGSADGTGTNAFFNGPSGIAFAPNGLLYVSDTGNQTIRCVTTNGIVTTLAGLAGQDGATNATGSAARFSSPLGIAVGSTGVIYVADSGNHLVREVTASGAVTTLAGSPGVWGARDGVSSNALFDSPTGIAVDGAGNVFVADSNNHAIRKISPSGLVTTWAGQLGIDGTNDGVGTNALFRKPGELKLDRNGNLFVADSFNHTIRCIDSNAVVTTVAGMPANFGARDGIGLQARFFNPYGLAIDRNGNLRVADTYNETLRFVYEIINGALTRDASGQVTIHWSAVIGDTYQVQFRDVVNSMAWQNLGSTITAATTSASQIDNSPSSISQRLYRVKLLP